MKNQILSIAIIVTSILYCIVLHNIYTYFNEDAIPDKFQSQQSTHICYDISHKTCDGNCECDGMECN